MVNRLRLCTCRLCEMVPFVIMCPSSDGHRNWFIQQCVPWCTHTELCTLQSLLVYTTAGYTRYSSNNNDGSQQQQQQYTKVHLVQLNMVQQ